MKWISKRFLWPLLVAGLAALFFLPVLRGEFLHWDDYALYVENPYYTGLAFGNWRWMCTTFRYGHWQPLTWLTCALDFNFWKLNASGWHLTNLGIHAINAMLVYGLCLTFLKDKSRRCTAALAALFWAVHPLRVEAVSWLATRGYLLCTAFCLLTVLFYLRAIEQKRYPLAALLCFALATLTKGIGMMLPLVLLLLDWFPLRRIISMRTAFRCAIEKTPFFILSLVTGITAFLAKKADGGMAPVALYGPVERIGQAVYGVWFYLFKTVSPRNLSPLYEKHPELWQVLAALLFLTAAGIIIFLFRKRLFPIIGTAGAFLLLIFPMLGITQSGSQMFADRFTYLAAVPFSIFLAAGLVRLQKPMHRAVCGLLAVLLLLLGVQSVVYSNVWKTELSLWSYAVTVDGSQSGAQNNLGIVLIGLNEYEKALGCLDKALAMRPEYADALNNRALIKLNKGQYEEAIHDLNIALPQGFMRANDRAKMWVLRGLALEGMSNNPAAIVDYSTVIERPDVDSGCRLKALQARARLRLAADRVKDAETDLKAMLVTPDSSGEFHRRAEAVLTEIKKIPRE
ncbi:MAG: tetratricopeptide repeat protein [Verrucomicrobia bacterium]|nr:tetratricopeptide repeat protein [Verrucomicrobiota bacterium]